MELARSKSESETHGTRGMHSKAEGDKVVLDVGGQIFKTTLQTLMRGGAYFGANLGSLKVSTLFIDRNPESFAIVLDVLRGYPNVLQHLTPALRVRVEADLVYFGVPRQLWQ
jgi:hypothetical protein